MPRSDYTRFILTFFCVLRIITANQVAFYFPGNLPSTPSSYVEHAIIQVLQPVIEGVSKLPQGLQNSILIQTVEIMMDTWSSYILKEQIKFR